MLRLERVWRAQNPKQAGGGANALAGFSYQFAVAIRNMVRRFHEQAGAAETDPSILLEELQDLARPGDSGGMVITEVKLSADRRRVRATLDNFVELDRLARRMERPVGEVRFELIVGRGHLTTVNGWIGEWMRENKYRRKDTARRVRVAHAPDPRHEAMALLANDLEDPHPEETFERMMGALHSRPLDAAGFRGAAQAAWSLLLHAKRTPLESPSVYVWTNLDRRPDVVRRGRVLTGDQPSVADLRDGAFAARPALTEALYRVARDWLEAPDPPRRIPVLFITGPSGCGKSIVLLQLLERIYREFGAPVFLAAPSEGDLAATVALARRLAREERYVIGLDTVGAAPGMSAWGQIVAALHTDRQRDRVLPVIVSAGSPEHAHALAERFADDLDVRPVAMPLERDSEIESLARWFARRTGGEIPDIQSDGRPLVWLVFEWHFGSLRQFSFRLRESIDELDPSGAVTQTVTDMLITHELGLSFPRTALDELLTPEQLRGLTGLLRHKSLALAAEQLEGTWLAHPAVGREIYRHWASRADSQERTRHVERAAATVICHGDTNLTTNVVRALYRRWRTTQLASGPLALVDWLSVLAAVHPLAVARHGGKTPLEELHMWIRVAGRRPLDDPDPIAQAMQWLVPQNAAREGMSATIEAIFKEAGAVSGSAQQELTESVMRLLDKRRDIRDWPRIAGAALMATDPEQLAPLLARWLATSHRGRPEGWLLAEAHKRFPADPAIREIADRVLRRPTLPSWPLVWSGLWAVDPSKDLAEQALLWLGRAHFDDRSWAWVWTTLWNAPPSLAPMRAGLAALAKEFLTSGPSTHGGWVRVFTALWSHDRCEELRLRAHQWLDDAAHHTHSGYPWLWERLWEQESERETLRSLAETWLLANPELPRWGVVYEKALGRQPTADLLELGCLWLELGPASHYDWGHVFPAAWNATADEGMRERLYRHGARWLVEAPDAHLGRSYVLEILIGHDGAPKLREETERWLERVKSSHPGWGVVWEQLGGPKDEASCIRAVAFLHDALPQRANHPGWARVWHETWRREKSHELYRLGQAWLDLVDYLDPGRSYVQQRILHRALGPNAPSAADTAEVIDRSMAWMREVKLWGDGGFIVWEHLFQSGQVALRPELVEIGMSALDVLDKDKQGWTDVWSHLWSHAQTDELARHADRWVEDAQRDTPGWHVMLTGSLAVHRVSSAELREIALHLLELPAPEPSPTLRRRISLWRSVAERYMALTRDHDSVSAYRLLVLARAVARGVLDDRPDAVGIRKTVADEAAAALLERPLDTTTRRLFLRICAEAQATRIDEVLESELEHQRADRELTSARALIVAASRAGELGVALDVLTWTAEQIEADPENRSLEILVNASQSLVDRVRSMTPHDGPTADMVERIRRAVADWHAASPDSSETRNDLDTGPTGEERHSTLDGVREHWSALRNLRSRWRESLW